MIDYLAPFSPNKWKHKDKYNFPIFIVVHKDYIFYMDSDFEKAIDIALELEELNYTTVLEAINSLNELNRFLCQNKKYYTIKTTPIEWNKIKNYKTIENNTNKRIIFAFVIIILLLCFWLTF